MLVPVVNEKLKLVGATRRVHGANLGLYLADAPFRKKKPIYTKDEEALTMEATDNEVPGPKAESTVTKVNATTTEADATDDDSRPTCAPDIDSKVDFLVGHAMRANVTHTAQYKALLTGIKALEVTVSLRDKAHEADLKARFLEGQRHGMKERETLLEAAQDRETLLLATQERNAQLKRENEELKIRTAQTEKMFLEGLQKTRDDMRATIASFANAGRSICDVAATSRAQVPPVNIQAPLCFVANAERFLSRETLVPPKPPFKRPATTNEKGNNAMGGDNEDDVKAVCDNKVFIA
ncbi:hypothetical protein SPRG_08859 [Saprolegnia parasitica CBS 223.65]|uniref:Uncharacterized protein n=1 Tax=Saprolegnia parasitica (strain CBS 223.65) TaxID=695850 RepID=A0A067C5X1_SAPPC|nr:hypothetical protein SPRG_08859 [Saprolegnia parasitica CBS 223.65]KDO25918.1 hypothetical protein SPRG_08859 [Saprolegnia parasitica CBS 223.65]|eukprot:XP_012203478.1 hypothetical protein SPRG_08859 [Saprolegnia parasitica CBS 223.65]